MATAFAMASATDTCRLPVFRRKCATTRIALVPMASAILAFEPRVLIAVCRVNNEDNDLGKSLRSSPPRKVSLTQQHRRRDCRACLCERLASPFISTLHIDNDQLC
jgi:hypothetical protein